MRRSLKPRVKAAEAAPPVKARDVLPVLAMSAMMTATKPIVSFVSKIPDVFEYALKEMGEQFEVGLREVRDSIGRYK